MCSNRIPKGTKRQLKDISSIQFVANLGHYLDFTLAQGRPTKDTDAYILEKMHRWLAAWKGNLPNNTSRACIGKSVTTSMPTYII